MLTFDANGNRDIQAQQAQLHADGDRLEATDKQIVLDIRVALDDGTRVTVEMQVRARRPSPLGSSTTPPATIWTIWADQLHRGEGYADLTPSIVVVGLLQAQPIASLTVLNPNILGELATDNLVPQRPKTMPGQTCGGSTAGPRTPSRIRR